MRSCSALPLLFALMMLGCGRSSECDEAASATVVEDVDGRLLHSGRPYHVIDRHVLRVACMGSAPPLATVVLNSPAGERPATVERSTIDEAGKSVTHRIRFETDGPGSYRLVSRYDSGETFDTIVHVAELRAAELLPFSAEVACFDRVALGSGVYLCTGFEALDPSTGELPPRPTQFVLRNGTIVQSFGAGTRAAASDGYLWLAGPGSEIRLLRDPGAGPLEIVSRTAVEGAERAVVARASGASAWFVTDTAVVRVTRTANGALEVSGRVEFGEPLVGDGYVSRVALLVADSNSALVTAQGGKVIFTPLLAHADGTISLGEERVLASGHLVAAASSTVWFQNIERVPHLEVHRFEGTRLALLDRMPTQRPTFFTLQRALWVGDTAQFMLSETPAMRAGTDQALYAATLRSDRIHLEVFDVPALEGPFRAEADFIYLTDLVDSTDGRHTPVLRSYVLSR